MCTQPLIHVFASQMTSDDTQLSSLVKHKPAVQTKAGLFFFATAAQTSSQTSGVLDGQGVLSSKSKITHTHTHTKGSGNRTLINPLSIQNLCRKPVEIGQLTMMSVLWVEAMRHTTLTASKGTLPDQESINQEVFNIQTCERLREIVLICCS